MLAVTAGSMAAKKLLILSLLFALVWTSVRADLLAGDGETEVGGAAGSDGSDSSALKIELDQLKSKIQALGQFRALRFQISISVFRLPILSSEFLE